MNNIAQATAGGTGAVFATIAIYPVIVIKTRLQAQKKDNIAQGKEIRGPINCLIRILKTQGFFGLYKGLIAAVPFVDVVTTMLDETIPLTTSEYDEWGNPNNKEYYDYMLSYSPYDNVEAKDYTNLLVTTGLHDSQVQYWEPAKWVAKLRSLSTSELPILLRTELDSGHGGPSGRYDAWRDEAFVLSFVLDILNLA